MGRLAVGRGIATVRLLGLRRLLGLLIRTLTGSGRHGARCSRDGGRHVRRVIGCARGWRRLRAERRVRGGSRRVGHPVGRRLALNRDGCRVSRGSRRGLGRIASCGRTVVRGPGLVVGQRPGFVAGHRLVCLAGFARGRVARLGRIVRIRLVGRKITLRAIVSRNRLGLEDDGLYLGRVLVHDDGGHAESLDGLPVADDIRRRCAGLDGRVLALELGKARAGGLERFLCSAELGFSSGDLVRCATVLFVEVHSMPLLSCGS